LEDRFAPPDVSALKAKGHSVETVGAFAIGSIQGVMVDPSGARMGGSDPRRMGYAVGY